MKKILTLTLMVLLLGLTACSEKEDTEQKEIAGATLIPSPTLAPTTAPAGEIEGSAAAKSPTPSISDYEASVLNKEMSGDQEEIATNFYEYFNGKDLGLPMDTRYYSIEIGNEVIAIDDKECYEVHLYLVKGGERTDAGIYYMSRDGEKVFRFDSNANGYYIIYNELEAYGPVEDEEEIPEAKMDQDVSSAVSWLRSQPAKSLGLPSEINMEKCYIQYDGVDTIGGNEYYCFFISKTQSDSNYYEYFVSTDYTSLAIYDKSKNAYIDLMTGQPIEE